MDKYEYRVKTEQMLEHYEKKQFKKAMEIADTIDWRRVKSPAMLNTVSEIYENNGEFQKSRDTLMIAFDRSPSSRKIVYRLAVLALKLHDLNEASDCYEEFVKLAPKDPNQFILKYRILKAQGSDLSEQISALEEFKKAEYIEKWAYELAKLYHEAGMTSKCLEECDDLILWFSEGKYVYQAMELKMKYKPLTPLQQEKYDEYKGVPKREPKKAMEKKPERAALKEVKSVPQDTVSIPKEQIKAAQEAAETETSDGLDATRRIPTEDLGKALKEMEENAQTIQQEEPGQPEQPEQPEAAVQEEAAFEEPAEQREEIISEESEEAVEPEEPTIEELDAAAAEPVTEEAPEEAQNVRELEGILQHATERPKKSITTVVKGATLQEALANGVAMASGINPEDQKKMEEREEELRIEGQMKIEDILMEWEAKQKANAEAIEKQKAADEERLRKEREALEAKREAERLEAERREAEEVARRKAEEKARREAEEKARLEAEEKARREAEEKARREAEEKARLEAEEKARQEAEEARRKAMLSDDIRQLVEELEDRVTAQEKAEDDFDIEEELELAKAEGESVEEEIVDQFVSEEELEDALEEIPEEAEVVEEELPEEEVEEDLPEEEFEAEEDLPEEEFEAEEDLPEEEFEAEEDLPEEEFEAEEDLPEEEFEAEEISDEDDSDEEEASGEDETSDEDEFEEDELEEDETSDEDEFEEDELEEDEISDEDEFEEGDFEEDETSDEDEFEEDDFEEDEISDADEFPEDEEEVEEFDAEWNEFPEDEEEVEPEFPEDDEFEEEDDFENDEFEEDDEFEEEDDFEDDEFEEEDDFEDDEFEDEDEFEDDDDFYEDDYVEDDEFEDDEFEEDEFEDDEFEDEDEFEEDEIKEDEFEESGFDDELPEIPDPEELEGDLEIEEPSEEEIQRRIKKSKGSGVPFDTGFVVTGRYDLSATSEIGLKAGLTEEQKKLFSYFVPVRGMSEQIVAVLDNDRRAQREGTSKTGNLMIIGRKGSGKTVLAVDIVKAIQKQRNLKQGKVAIVTGESLNKKELSNIIQKLRGGAIIIEKAGKLNSRTIKELNALMARKTGELLFVLEDQRKPLERIMTANPDFKKKFTSKLELPVFINDELVTFGQTYAKENGYKLDEMGILALYSRIDVMQREDHAVTVAEVKELMDEAIQHSQKANVKHLARRVFGKSTDSSDRIILKEEDFKI